MGANNSLAYRVHEIERHFHSRERWFGKLAIQTATDWADNNIATPFVAISGNNDYGTDPGDEAQVIGTADTPTMNNLSTGSPNTKFDPHRVFITATTSTTAWKLQFIYGTGSMADAITAGQFSTTMVKIDAAIGATPSVAHEIQLPRLTCGSDKVWCRGWNATNNATISFFVGWHEYEG